MVETLFIGILGTSIYRPLKVIKETKPDLILLLTSSQPGWNESTEHISQAIKKQCEKIQQSKLLVECTNLIDFDSVFKLVRNKIENFQKDSGRRPVHIDVSATTGISMAAAILAGCLFNDVHIHYVHAVFTPDSIDKTLGEEEKKIKEIEKQTVFEIPKPLVPMIKLEKGTLYYAILNALYEMGDISPSITTLMEKMGLERGNEIRKSAAKYGAYIKMLRKWGLVEKHHEKRKSEKVELTKFGLSLLKAMK